MVEETSRTMAALRIVQAWVLWQMRAPYTAHTTFPLPPIAGPGAAAPLAPPA